MCIKKIKEGIRNFENKRFLRKLKKQKENAKRIAVVGNVSSGKSFLIRDMCRVIRRECHTVGNFNAFRIGDHSKSKDSSQTKIYLCRCFPTTINHFYEASWGNNRGSIQILDMPGEAFGDATHNLFQTILNILISIGKKFEVVEYIKGSESKLILKSNNHHVATDEKIKEELLDILSLKYRLNKDIEDESVIKGKKENIDKELQNILMLKNNLKQDIFRQEQINGDDLFDYLNDDYYHSVDVIELCCIYGNYQKSKQFSVTGREVVLNFLRYNTDSVMGAISDVLNREILNQYNEVLTQKKLFFWFYTFLSTDIIFCNRVAFPLGTEANGDAVSLNNLFGIKNNKDIIGEKLFGNEWANNCNYYLVYRAVDMMIDRDYYRKTYDDYDGVNYQEDMLYSVVARDLFRFIRSREREIEPFANMFTKEGYTFNICAQDRPCKPDLLTIHRGFADIGNFANRVTGQVIGENDYPYYVFFSSSAMDRYGTIHINRRGIPGFELNGNINIDGDDNHNLCFGTRQLVLSLLYRSLGQNDFNYGENPADHIKELLKMITGTEQR